MTVFKAKQLKGKLIFSYEEDEWRYLCWDCFEQMLRRTLYDRTLYLKSVLGTVYLEQCTTSTLPSTESPFHKEISLYHHKNSSLFLKSKVVFMELKIGQVRI